MNNQIDEQLAAVRMTLDRVLDAQRLLTRRLDELVNASTINLGGSRLVTTTRLGQKMFIDGRDTGSGLNLVTSGWIEPNVMKVLQRFFMPGSTFLDIGANFGFYTIMAGMQLGLKGRVFAFEANLNLLEYIERSCYINGLTSRVTVVGKAVADHAGMAQFGFNFSEIGGGSLSKGEHRLDKDLLIDVELVRVDDIVPSDIKVDCIKLDVEGAELAALSGMSGVIERSNDIKIVLEFFPGLLNCRENSRNILDLLEKYGLSYWRIDQRGYLEDVSKDELSAGGDCYLVAARQKPDDRTLVVSKVAMHCPVSPIEGGFYKGPPGAVLVHGPYWYLQSGVYDIEVVGEIRGEILVSFTHEYGFKIASALINEDRRIFTIELLEDVRAFEVVLRSTGEQSCLRVECINIRDHI